MAGLVIPWMLSRRIFLWRLAPPFPSPLPPFPRPDIMRDTLLACFLEVERRKSDDQQSVLVAFVESRLVESVDHIGR